MPGTPRARPGQLKVQWGKLKGFPADLLFIPGEGVDRADARLLNNVISEEPRLVFDNAVDLCLLDDLASRWYDLSTLKISIEQKRDGPPRKIGTPRARPGQIKVQWGRTEGDAPDLCLLWGPGTSKADTNLLYHHLTRTRWRSFQMDDYGPSLLKELEARGYDLQTLKISIEKKR